MPNFAPFVLLLLAIALFLRVDFFFTMVYFLAGVYGLSRVWIGRATGRLRLERTFLDHAFVGDEVPIHLSIRNVGRLPLPWLRLHESEPAELTLAPLQARVVSLAGGEEWRDTYRLGCRRRGYYPIGPTHGETGDLIGLASRSIHWVSGQFLTVYPRVVPLARLGLPTRSPAAVLAARAPLFEDATRLMGVRDYRPGDPWRRMHWPATARTGRLVVKQYQPAIARETLICLDLNRENYALYHRYEATELAVTVAASLASHIILREGLPAGLATEAVDIASAEKREFLLPPRADRAHLMTNLLETLARVQITADAALADLLERAAPALPWGATLIVITGQESAALLNSLLPLQQRGLALALVLVQPAAPSPELRAQAAVLHMPVYQVWTELDLETWQ